MPSLRIDRLVQLSSSDLQDDVLEALSAVVESGKDERVVVIVFLYLLAVSEDGAGMSRESKRAIRKAYKDIGQNEAVISEIQEKLAGIPVGADIEPAVVGPIHLPALYRRTPADSGNGRGACTSSA